MGILDIINNEFIRFDLNFLIENLIFTKRSKAD